MWTLFSWNLENLPPLLPRLPEIVAGWGDPEVVCLQETRVRPQDRALIAQMESALPGYRCHFALCDDPRNVTYRGGRAYGVTTYIRSRFGTARETRLAGDREGRVVVTELARKNLAVINLYGVNGTSKPYFDHELGRVHGDRHALKRRLNRKIADEIHALVARGFQVVAVGDWNISRSKIDIHPRLRTEEPHATARRELNEEIIPSLGLVDVFRALHPDAKKYTWFNRASRRLDAARVDYALCTPALAGRAVAADIDEANRFTSDHAPLWVRFR